MGAGTGSGTATVEDHQAQEWLRVAMVVLEEPKRVVQVDGDAWGRAVTQKLEAGAHHQERRPPQEASCDEYDCELMHPTGSMVKSVCNANDANGR